MIDSDKQIVFERCQAQGPSLKKLTKEARKAACKGIGVEVDISNCHPQLLANTLEEEGKLNEFPMLKLYC